MAVAGCLGTRWGGGGSPISWGIRKDGKGVVFTNFCIRKGRMLKACTREGIKLYFAENENSTKIRFDVVNIYVFFVNMYVRIY